jgi:BASS family bile acid:Na+ symporter
VPIFARFARADLPLAAALTGIFPVASAVITPLVVRAALAFLHGQYVLRFNLWSILVTLLATITLPLAIGVLLKHIAPGLSRFLLRPVEVLSEALGAISLTFVVVSQFYLIMRLGWRSWVGMAILFEISLLLGWLAGGPGHPTRRVIALGSSNRNIALALLLAIESFHGTDVAAAVAGNGLLLIVLGLLHVAWWRFSQRDKGLID